MKDNKCIIILFLIIVMSSYALCKVQQYNTGDKDGIICEFMISPDHISEKYETTTPVYFKGQIYTDRTMRCYVVERKNCKPNVWVTEDVGSIEKYTGDINVV